MEQKAQPTRIVCPSCGAAYRVNRPAAEVAKLRVKCKKCGHAFRPQVPQVDGAPSAGPSPSAAPASAPAAAPSAPPPPPSPPSASPPPAPAPPPAAGEDPFGLLEEHIGELNREVYQARQQAGAAFPEGVAGHAGALGEILIQVKREMNTLRRSGQDLETLLEVSRVLNEEHELAPLLERVMDYAIQTLNAQRGFLMLKSASTGALEVRVARGMGEDLAEGEARAFSTGIASQVAAAGTPFFTSNSKGDDRTAGFASVMRSDARAIICVPVNYKDRNLGTLYVDNQMGAPGFTEDLVRLAQSFAGAASGAIENARLYENIREETQKRANLSRYLSPAVVEDILQQEDELALGGATVECSVLFSDIAGFTSFSENLRPDELVELLNEYFTRMADMIFQNNGTLDKFIGDATMAVFGAPVYDPHHATGAVKAGLDMIAASKDLMAKWEAEGKPTFRMRVGVNSGPVVAGNLGSPQRMDYTVIGDAVNLAQRMESSSKPDAIVVSGFTWDRIKDYAQGEDLGAVKVKGKSEEIRVFLVHSIEPPERDAGQVKRTAQRADVEVFAIYNQEGVSGTRQGIVRNLSTGGALLHTSFPAEAGNVVKLNFTLPSGAQVKDLSGNVVRASWTEEGGQKGFHVNLQFFEVSEENKSAVGAFVQETVAAGGGG